MVDGDAAVRASLKFSLELDGYVVEVHESGEALAGRSDLPRHGCLILDFGLPGMNGLRLLGVLRSRHVGLPAVLTATQPSRAARAAAAAAGVPIIEKPLLSNALLTTVQSALAADRASAGVPP